MEAGSLGAPAGEAELMGAHPTALKAPTLEQAGSGTTSPWQPLDLFAVVATLALGIGVRAFILRSSLGVLNSDEVTTGLMAQEVLRGRTPLVLAGQNYSGTLEAYLYAPLHAILGPSSLALKLISTFFWFAVAYATYRVTSFTADRRLGILLGSVVWVSSFPVVLLSTQAYPGYSSGEVAVLVALFLLLKELTATGRDAGTTRRRLLLGFCTGFAVWSHPMFLATLFPAHLFLLVHKRRNLLNWVPPIAVGALVGISPLLVWNVANSWGSLEVLPQPPSTYSSRLAGFFVDVVPRLLGTKFAAATWIGGALGTTMYVVMVMLLVLALWMLWRGAAQERLIAVVALFAPLVIAAFPTSWYTQDARYGMTYFPVMVLAAGLGWRRWRPDARVSAAALLVVPLLCFAVTCAPPLAALAAPPARPGDPDGEVVELISALEAADVRHLRASFWIAQPVTFLSGRRIVASGSDVSRFPELEAQVQRAGDRAAFVAMAGDAQDDELRRALPTHSRREVARYAVYLPAR